MTVMVSPGVPVPAKVGVLILVLLSVLLLPVSVAAVRSGAAGVAGAVVSIVTANAGLGALVLPAVSLAVVVIWCTPSVRTGDVNVQVPSGATTAVPNTVVPSLMVMVSPGEPVPAKVGVLSPVLLSVLLPVSVAAVRSGAAGVVGAVVSMVTVNAGLVMPLAGVTVI